MEQVIVSMAPREREAPKFQARSTPVPKHTKNTPVMPPQLPASDYDAPPRGGVALCAINSFNPEHHFFYLVISLFA
jgi:hypothetical protein